MRILKFMFYELAIPSIALAAATAEVLLSWVAFAIIAYVGYRIYLGC